LPDDFQLVAGHLALDFANSLDNRYDPARRLELLSDYERFVAFARQSGILTASQARKLLSETGEASAAEALTLILELREAMYFLFLAVITKSAPPRKAFETFNQWLAEARSAQTLTWEKGSFNWRFEPAIKTPLAPLYPILFAAADLLTSTDLAFVRECGDETCRWLFLDRSKNHSRRWCDMKVCGNRAKAERFHSRQS
jgi:predicted RNA-binding Zn ribbon-like protein